jgi:ribokinase
MPLEMIAWNYNENQKIGFNMTVRKPKVVVVGSAYLDMAVRCDHFPQQGTSVEGTKLACSPSGSAVNRAIEAAICGCETYIIGKIGDDLFSRVIIERLEKAGVNTEYLFKANAISTGTCFTIVDECGDNTTCRCPGANKSLGSDEINYAPVEQLFSEADVCLIDASVPDPAVAAAIKLANLYRKKTILEADIEIHDERTISEIGFPKEYYLVNILVPKFLDPTLNSEVKAGNVHKLKLVASQLVSAGIENVVIKMGSRGVFLVNRNESCQITGFEVDLIDRACSGDAFAGALAASCGTGDQLGRALKFAAAASALACAKFGSSDSLPTKQEIIELLQQYSD